MQLSEPQTMFLRDGLSVIRMTANFQAQGFLLLRHTEQLGQKVSAIVPGTVNVFKIWSADFRIRITQNLDPECPRVYVGVCHCNKLVRACHLHFGNSALVTVILRSLIAGEKLLLSLGSHVQFRCSLPECECHAFLRRHGCLSPSMVLVVHCSGTVKCMAFLPAGVLTVKQKPQEKELQASLCYVV